MAKIKVPYLSSKPGRDGTRRWFWTPGPGLRAHGWSTVRLGFDQGYRITEAQAAAEAQVWNGRVEQWRAGGEGEGTVEPRQSPGTVAALFTDYRASDDFTALKATTQRGYRQALAVIEGDFGDVPVAALTAKKLKMYHAAIAGRAPAQANTILRVFRLVLEKSRLLYEPGDPGYLEINPARKLAIKGGGRKGLLWPREAVIHFAAAADAEGWPSIGTAVVLNEWLGQRLGDILTLPRSVYADGKIYVEQSKTDAVAVLPISMVPHLTERLEDERRRQGEAQVTATTLLVCETTGRPWETDYFRSTVAEIRAVAAKDHPTFQQDHLAAGEVHFEDLKFGHLRHTAVTRLAEAGVEIPQIAAVTGHSLKTVQSIIDRYMIRTARMAENAFRLRLEAEED